MIVNSDFQCLFLQASRQHITDDVLKAILTMTQHLLASPGSVALVKQLFDYVLFNPALWIQASVNVQMDLYTFLATEFVSNASIYGNIRRTSTVIQTLHALKHYYYVVNPAHRSGIEGKVDGMSQSNYVFFSFSLIVSYLFLSYF